MRGYFGIGIENSKTPANIGTLWRSANIFGAAFIFTVKQRYPKQCSDTLQTPRHVPLLHYVDIEDLRGHLPHNCQVVGVELVEDSVTLPKFRHPERAIYLLGAEDHGLSKAAMACCHTIVQVPTARDYCLNVSSVGSIVLYDRFVKQL